jgi:Chaperone of endosialidase
MLSGPFDWPTTTTAKLLAVDESEAAYTGNKAALEQRSAWPMINGDVINEVRIVQDPDETTGLTPFVVHSFGSSVSQSRAVFRNTGTTETSVNDMPFIGSQGDNLVFGAGGEVPKWFVEPVSQYLGGATSDPLTRIHIAGNGTGNRIIQEAVPVDSGASAPVLEHRMTGLGNSSGFRVYDKDFLVSDLPVLSHAIKANKQSASFAIPRTYTMTFSLSETGAANAADVLTLSSDALYPADDNVTDLGKPSSRWQQLHAGTTEIAVSDERLKEQIADIQDEILDAWGLVRYRMFKFKDAAAEKGDAARWHFGPIAQEVRDAFASKGLDATMYAPFCYDHWGVQYDPTGTITADAGDIYSLRLQECAMIEAAYMRRELARIVDILNA